MNSDLKAKKIDNPWRDSLKNCTNGSNYLRVREYLAIIDYIDSLLEKVAELEHDRSCCIDAERTSARIDELQTAYNVRNDEVTGLMGINEELKAEVARLQLRVDELQVERPW